MLSSCDKQEAQLLARKPITVHVHYFTELKVAPYSTTTTTLLNHDIQEQ